MNNLELTKIIDSHIHMWPVSKPERPYPWTPDPHPVEALLPVLNEIGINRAIQVTPTIMGFDNDYGLQIAQEMPHRFGVFGRFDVSAPDSADRLAAWMASTGAEGIRLTFFGASAVKRGALLSMKPLWELCEELCVPVAVLAPDAISELAEVARRHTRLRLIVDHLGLGVFEGSPDPFAGWSYLSDLASVPTVRVKISTLVETSKELFPFRDVHDLLAEVVELFGVERLVWGSNYPVVLKVCSYRESLDYLGHCSFLAREQLGWLTHRSWESYMGIAKE